MQEMTKLCNQKQMGALKKALKQLGRDNTGGQRVLQWRIQEAVHSAMMARKEQLP
jgi:hypothetical protein